MQGDVKGRICYKRGTGEIVFKHGGDAIAYKAGRQLGAATITISWGAGDKDLDICGYWHGNEAEAVGWSHQSQSQSPYFASWGGDNTSEAGRETITVQMIPWSYSGARWFYVKFNYYGESNGSGTCNVSVSQGGRTRSMNNVGCSKNRGVRATPGDPGVVIKFNDLGECISIGGA